MTKEVKAVHTPGAAMVANAHLTAAAPDLLAALRECSELLGGIPASKSNPRAADAIRKDGGRVMVNTRIYRDLVSLFEHIDAEARDRSTLDGMRALEDLMRAGYDVIMQGRAADLDALFVIDVLRGYFAIWYERLRKIREEEIEQERQEAEQYWHEEGRYLEREQAEADLLEFRHGE